MEHNKMQSVGIFVMLHAPKTPRSPANWKLIYGLVAGAVFVYFEFWLAYSISEPFFTTPARDQLSRIFKGVSFLNTGRFDGSDYQYISFQRNIKMMGAYFVFFIFGKLAWERVFGLLKGQNEPNQDQARRRVLYYNIYYILQGVGFILFLHGGTSVYYFTSVFLFYLISRLGSHKLNPALTWILSIIIMFSSEYLEGYHFFNWLLGEEHWIASILDGYRGALQWQSFFRMTMLRVVSYNFDKYWALRNIEVYQAKDSYTERVVKHQPLEFYNAISFLGYIFYPILYIAGPIMTFNCFVSQIIRPITSNTMASKIKHGVWSIFLIIVLDVILHYNWLHSISVSMVWEEWDSPLAIGLVGFWTLQFMFFKFISMWKFFRSFALFADMVPLQNMTRCMHNTKTFTDFWRAWHTSFNKWIVRYLYVPLGGTKTQALSIWFIFLFIGLWHDLWWRWVFWALMNCLFFTIELGFLSYWKRSQFDSIRAIPGWIVVQHGINSFNCIFILMSNLSLIYGPTHMYNFVVKVFFSGVASLPVYFIFIFFFGSFCLFHDEIRVREARCPFQTNKLK